MQNFHVHACACEQRFATGAELTHHQTHGCEQVARVASSLSSSAVERLMQPGDGACNAFAAMQFVDHDMLRVSDDGEGWDFNDFGLAVRAHLTALATEPHQHGGKGA